MQLAYFCGIVIASLVSPALPILILWKQIQSQNRQIQTLTNLATSKNLEMFTTLQTVTNLNQPQSEPAEVQNLSDESQARLLMAQYQEAGLDPNFALNQEDHDFAADFGGFDAFRTH